MRIPLATDIKTRTGAPDKDARQKNSYIEVKGTQPIVRKRPCAQGGIAVGSGVAQGGYGLVLFWADTAYPITSSTLTTCNNATSYVKGDHVTVDSVDYWANTSTSNTCPVGGVSGADWSTTYVPAEGSSSSWTVGSYPLYTGAGSGFGAGASPIAFNGTVYVYLSSNPSTGYDRPITSTDGLNWTVNPDITTVFNAGRYSIIWNGTKFCCIGDEGIGSIVSSTSSDGITWTRHVQITATTQGRYYDLAWNGSIFCAVGNETYSATSLDGITWTENFSTIQCISIAWNGSVFCAIEYALSTSSAQTSTDGITWTSRTMSVTTGVYCIKSKGSILCVGGDNYISSSSDNGITWTSTFISGFSGTRIAVGDSLFLISNAGDITNVYKTSTDGINWIDRTLPLSKTWVISYYGSKFLVMDDTTICATSITGL